MNLPELRSKHEMAVDLVVYVINKAQEKLGIRQNLQEIAHSREILTSKAILVLGDKVRIPVAATGETFIRHAIEMTWRLTDVFAYSLRYLETTSNECAQYYYFEAIFSQPTIRYPIPQATCSVFFIVEDKQTDPPAHKGISAITFRVEGHHTDHDVRYVKLIPDWILEVLQTKINFFRRIEELKMF